MGDFTTNFILSCHIFYDILSQTVMMLEIYKEFPLFFQHFIRFSLYQIKSDLSSAE